MTDRRHHKRIAGCLAPLLALLAMTAPAGAAGGGALVYGDYECTQYSLGRMNFFGTVTLNQDGTYAVYEAKPSGKYQFDGSKIHWKTGPLSETADSSIYKWMPKSVVFDLFVRSDRGDRKAEWSCEKPVAK